MPVRSVGVQGLDRALGQHGAKAKGHVGGVNGLKDRQFQGLGKALAAIGRISGQTVPAAFSEGLIGVGKSGCRRDLAIGIDRAMLVTDPVEGGQDASGQIACGFQNRRHQVRVEVGKAAALVDLADIDHIGQGKAEVTKGGAIGHLTLSERAIAARGAMSLFKMMAGSCQVGMIREFLGPSFLRNHGVMIRWR